MLELGSSGSVRGVSSNGHPYRDPGPSAAIPVVQPSRLLCPKPAVRNNRGDRLSWVGSGHSLHHPPATASRSSPTSLCILQKALAGRERSSAGDPQSSTRPEPMQIT